MEFIKNYMKEDALRHKLNKLTQEVFGFDFEEWVKNNYFHIVPPLGNLIYLSN